MAAPQEVIVDIDEKGNVKVDVVGGKGSGCKKHLDTFRALGSVTKEDLKPEYYKSGNSMVLNTVANH